MKTNTVLVDEMLYGAAFPGSATSPARGNLLHPGPRRDFFFSAYGSGVGISSDAAVYGGGAGGGAGSARRVADGGGGARFC